MSRLAKQSRRRRGKTRRKEFETRWRLGEFTTRWQAVLGRVEGRGYKVHLHKPAQRFSGKDWTVCRREARVHRLRLNPFQDYPRDSGYGVSSTVCKQCVTIALQTLDVEASRA